MTKEKSTNLSDVRKANCKLIFDTLSKSEGMTLLNLERTTGLSRPTVVRMVRAMEEVELVKGIGKKESNGGRSPILYTINPDAYYAVGIDFEFPVVRIALADMKGQAVSRFQKEFELDLSTEDIVEDLIVQLKGLIEKAGIAYEKILGIGFGMPGYINLKNGCSMRFERIRGWENIEIVKLISEGTGLTVFMENDVHLLYRADREQRKEKKRQDELFLAIRSGIGSAIYQKGHLLEGEYGNAGHIGHTVIQMNGEQCTCGNYGCLELYASERAIRKQYEQLTGNRSSIQEIGKRAKEEKEARQVLENAGKYLGIGIGNVINMLDIDTVIVATRFEGGIMLESAQRMLDRVINIPQDRNTKIYQSQLSEEEYALGGCKLVFHRNRNIIISKVPLKNL